MANPSRKPGKPQFLGEDTRITSTKELAGWYMYGWAAEVFVVCGIGSFIPITLEQLARENGFLASDHTVSCRSGSQVSDTSSPTNRTDSSLSSLAKEQQCIIYLLGIEINTASFAMYTFSLSVLIQALVIISMSGAADHGRYRKTLLLSFAFTGAVATLLFLPITARVYYLGALLAILSNTCFGASFVLLNSFLPLLVRHHSSLQPASLDPLDPENQGESTPNVPEEDDSNTLDSQSSLLNEDAPYSATPALTASSASTELQVSTEISANGIGIGYVAAVIVQILSVILVQLTGGTLFSLRMVLFFVGAWWFTFTIPCIFWLRPRPGPPLHTTGSNGKTRTWLAYMGHAWQSLFRTIARARRLRDVLIFLAAWFLLSDAIATVSGTAVLFAKTTLGMKPAALALINVVVMVFGVLGALTWSTVSRLLRLKPTHTILACLCFFELIPLYALLGYIPAVEQAGWGLNSAWEMYPLGAVYGLVLGGLSSYCRALFGELIPQGFEATFYSLYAITDKGSSIFGPAIVGAIVDATGEIRPAFWFLALLIGLPIPLILFVDVDRGKRDGAAMARELDV